MEKKIAVLLVEDNKTDRCLIKNTLESTSEPVVFETETALSFSQTREKLKKGHYNVVILDLGLPDSWGIDTLRKLRQIDREIPVVVLTGLSEKNAGIRAMKKGADDYLSKNEFLKYNLARTLRYAIERKTWQQNLHKSQQLLKLSLDSLKSNIVILNKRGAIVEVNQSWCRFVRDNDLHWKNYGVGKNYLDICESELEDKYAELACEGIKKILAGEEKEFSMEYPYHSSGEKHWFSMQASSFDFKDSKCVMIVHDNITERKLAEQKQVTLLNELEKSNKELKDFARIVSHDLKAPLRGIKMLAEWISEDYSDKLDEDGKENLELLTERTHKMHRLIDGILEYSRVGRIREKSVPVDLNELVGEITEMLAPPDNIKIKVKSQLPVITGEQTRITQLFQNLLSNAVKYIDKSEGLVEIDCVTEDGFHKFSISDNGPGIEEKNFERVFQIFQTLVPNDDPESTGIGLTIAKKIVRLYGGDIWLESKPGEGTTFFFTFPVTNPDAEEKQENSKDAEYCGT